MVGLSSAVIAGSGWSADGADSGPPSLSTLLNPVFDTCRSLIAREAWHAAPRDGGVLRGSGVLTSLIFRHNCNPFDWALSIKPIDLSNGSPLAVSSHRQAGTSRSPSGGLRRSTQCARRCCAIFQPSPWPTVPTTCIQVAPVRFAQQVCVVPTPDGSAALSCNE
jgi:hypothetical protein